MTSRLSILMKMFSVSGSDLSKLIHVDDSLVSKWRSGKRSLKPKSNYVEKIVEYIMETDRHNRYENICKLLASEYDNIFSCSKTEIGIFLKQWLTSESDFNDHHSRFDTLKNLDDVKISMSYYFKKNSGRRCAVEFLNNYVLNSAEKLELISYTTEEASWFYEDKEFLRRWSEINFACLRNGHIIKVIHPLNRSFQDMAISIIRWVPLHLTGQTKAYYIPKYSDELVEYTYFLVRNHMVLRGLSSVHYVKGVQTWVTDAPQELEAIEGILQELLDKATLMFTRYYCKPDSLYLNELAEILQSEHLKYFHSATFLYFPLSEDLVSDILRDNGLSEEEVALYAGEYRKISLLNMAVRCRYMINLSTLRFNLAQKEIIINSLSYIAGKPVRISRERYFRFISEVLVGSRQEKSVEIGIIDNSIDDFDRLNVLVQSDTCIQFLRADTEDPFGFSIHELTMVIAIFERAEQMWNSIPDLKKNKEYVYKQMDEALAAAVSEIK